MTLPGFIVIALTIWMEGRGEPKEGRVAIAESITTRSVERKILPHEVCLQQKQFSCWTGRRDVIVKRYTEGKLIPKAEQTIWEHCKELARQVQEGELYRKKGFNHFYNPNLCSPSWAKKLRNQKQIGNHIFGRL